MDKGLFSLSTPANPGWFAPAAGTYLTDPGKTRPDCEGHRAVTHEYDMMRMVDGQEVPDLPLLIHKEKLEGRIHELECSSQGAKRGKRVRPDAGQADAEQRHVPKPPSAFVLTCKSIRATLSGSAAQQSKEASLRWKGLSADQKSVFQGEAALRVEQHKAARKALRGDSSV